MKSVKTKKIFVSALFALSLFFGISAATLMKNNSAAAEVSAAIEVVGAAVRYPEGAESAPKGTGLKFEVKLSNVAIESVVNLGVLVDKEGVPEIETADKEKHIKFIENSVASSKYKYSVKDNDVYMYVSLVHVPKNYFHNEFVCRAYYQTETGKPVYSNTLERSVTYVIKEAIADETENAPTAEQKALLEKLRNASEDHTYTASYGEIVTPATDVAQGTRKVFCACGKEGVAPIGLYHYQFDTDGGIPVEGIDGSSYDTISELPTPERSGAEFLGWYNEAGEKVEKIDVPYAGVTGETVTLKAKWLVYLTENNLMEGFTFDSETKIAETTTCEPGIATSYDSGNDSMKITVSVNNKKAKINISSFTLNVGNKIVVRALSAINVGFCVNGAYKMTVQETNGTNFKEYVWTVTEETVVNGIAFMPYVKSGELYVQSILVVKDAKNITVERLENGYAFDNSASILAYTTCEKGIMAGYDSVTNSMLIKPTDKNKTVSINIDTITLNAGDTIVVKIWCLLPSGTNVSFITTADGKKSYTNIYANTGFQEYAYTATAECTVTALQITPYTASGELYVQSIQIVRANAN